MRKRRRTHPWEGWGLALQGSAWCGWAGRTQQACVHPWRVPRTKSQQQKCAFSLPKDCQPSAGNRGTSFPMALSPPPYSSQCHSAPQKSQLRRAAAAVNRPILMHITPNITMGGTRPFPCNPLRLSAVKRSHPWPSSCLCRSWLGLLFHQPCPWLWWHPCGSERLSGWSSREVLLGSRAGEGRAWGQGASPKAHQSRFGEAKTSGSWSPVSPRHAHLSLSETSHHPRLSSQSPCAGRGKNRSGGGGRST